MPMRLDFTAVVPDGGVVGGRDAEPCSPAVFACDAFYTFRAGTVVDGIGCDRRTVCGSRTLSRSSDDDTVTLQWNGVF